MGLFDLARLNSSIFNKAGKPIGEPNADIKDLFIDIRLQDKVDVIRKELGYVDAKDYGSDILKPPDLDTSGAFTEIRHCLRPPEPTRFQVFDEEIKNTIYDSYWNKPLAKSRDPTPGLPVGLNPFEKIMGKPSHSSVKGGEVINPPKKPEEIMEEERLFHNLYAFTHQNHYPGEQIKMGYNPPFNENNIYGKPSNKDESGKRVQNNLTWFNNDPLSHVSRRQASVRNRTLPPLGKALDKTGVAEMFPLDHTYGKATPKDFYGVADLLNDSPPSLVRRDMLDFLAYANSLRQNVYKKINEGDLELEELYEEILNLKEDKNDPDCSVKFDCIDQIMKRHRMYLNKTKLQPLLLALDILSKDGSIKVRDFINFIDKNASFPILKKQFYILPPEFQDCNKNQYDFECPKNDCKIQSMPPAGKPSIRLDKPHPVYRDSIVYMNDLAEETTARTLISPSIYNQYGLSHRDFFQPRTKEFLGNLFKKINVTLSDEDLDEIYKEGYDLDKTGGVCVETFRNLLDLRAYNAYNKIS